jgi:hypothetical protein
VRLKRNLKRCKSVVEASFQKKKKHLLFWHFWNSTPLGFEMPSNSRTRQQRFCGSKRHLQPHKKEARSVEAQSLSGTYSPNLECGRAGAARVFCEAGSLA